MTRIKRTWTRHDEARARRIRADATEYQQQLDRDVQQLMAALAHEEPAEQRSQAGWTDLPGDTAASF